MHRSKHGDESVDDGFPIAELLSDAGLLVHTRICREPVGGERSPQAYPMAADPQRRRRNRLWRWGLAVLVVDRWWDDLGYPIHAHAHVPAFVFSRPIDMRVGFDQSMMGWADQRRCRNW